MSFVVTHGEPYLFSFPDQQAMCKFPRDRGTADIGFCLVPPYKISSVKSKSQSIVKASHIPSQKPRSCPKSETDMCYRCYKSRLDILPMPGGWVYLYVLVVYVKCQCLTTIPICRRDLPMAKRQPRAYSILFWTRLLNIAVVYSKMSATYTNIHPNTDHLTFGKAKPKQQFSDWLNRCIYLRS